MSSPASFTLPRHPHWVIPFASSLSEPCMHALARLAEPRALPHLRTLLARLQPVARIDGEEYALSMPHERWLAQQLGWTQDDGLVPMAAWWAQGDGVVLSADQAWGLLSPGHWLVGRDHLTLLDPISLGLDEAASRTLLEAIRPLFESEGWTLLWGAPTRWYASHASLASLPTASLDRVAGRNPDVWLQDHPQARAIRRLQSEVQMLLYQHPINDERQAQGLATVNSFWLSACGRPPAPPPATPNFTLVASLREPMLADDMGLWLEAWQHLDATVLRDACTALDAGQRIGLTLCGERHAVTWSNTPTASPGRSLWQAARRLLGRDAAPSLSDTLRAL